MFLRLQFRGLADDEALSLYLEWGRCDPVRKNCCCHALRAYSLPPDPDKIWQATCSEPCRIS